MRSRRSTIRRIALGGEKPNYSLYTSAGDWLGNDWNVERLKTKAETDPLAEGMSFDIYRMTSRHGTQLWWHGARGNSGQVHWMETRNLPFAQQMTGVIVLVAVLILLVLVVLWRLGL